MGEVEFILFRIALAIYLVGGIVFVCSMIFRNRKLAMGGFIITAGAAICNGVSLILRGLDVGHPPFTNLYETLSLLSFFLALTLLIAKRKLEGVAPFVLPLILFTMIIGLVNYTRAGELAPALKSYWLFIHVPIAIFSYALFALAFIGGTLYMIKDTFKGNKSVLSRLSSLETLDNLIYRTIAMGFIFLTIGIVTGSVWAEAAWGSYWSWDPKETWSLVTWLVYALYLHARMVKGWYGRRSATIAIAGFAAVLFTYFGVSLFSGLHT